MREHEGQDKVVVYRGWEIAPPDHNSAWWEASRPMDGLRAPSKRRLYAMIDKGEAGTDVRARGQECRHCTRAIEESVDPNVPWVHSDTRNSYCDVEVPEDAVMFAGTAGRTEAEPTEKEN